MCEEERKGEEGGCVDCKKTIIFRCLTPPEMELYKKQVAYNKELNKVQDSQKDLETHMGVFLYVFNFLVVVMVFV